MRANLIVLADRVPVRGAGRSDIEAAIERELRARDGIWLARRNVSSGADPFCEGALWPLLHGRLDRVRYAVDDWLRYAGTNATFAERALELVTHGGAVWAYGHRWLLVASELRGLGHRGPIGLFLDAPFPAPALLDGLPWRDDLLGALRAFDFIGCHAPESSAHLEACLGRGGAPAPRILTFPAGEPAAAEPAPHAPGDPDAWVGSFVAQLVALRPPTAEVWADAS